jgi:predicted metal-dependent HD superfamily phosphohydrolase
MEVQTRSETTGLVFFDTFKDAYNHAKEDETVWKISIALPTGERVRLVRDFLSDPKVFVLEQLMDTVKQETEKKKPPRGWTVPSE